MSRPTVGPCRILVAAAVAMASCVEPLHAGPADDLHWSDSFGRWSIPADVADDVIGDVVVWEDRLVIGGKFTSAGGAPGTRAIAQLVGTTWTAVGAPFPLAEIMALEVHDNRLYAAAAASDCCDAGIFRLDFNGQWTRLATLTAERPSDRVRVPVLRSVTTYRGQLLFVGGYFARLDTMLVNDLAVLTPDGRWRHVWGSRSGAGSMIGWYRPGPGGVNEAQVEDVVGYRLAGDFHDTIACVGYFPYFSTDIFSTTHHGATMTITSMAAGSDRLEVEWKGYRLPETDRGYAATTLPWRLVVGGAGHFSVVDLYEDFNGTYTLERQVDVRGAVHAMLQHNDLSVFSVGYLDADANNVNEHAIFFTPSNPYPWIWAGMCPSMGTSAVKYKGIYAVGTTGGQVYTYSTVLGEYPVLADMGLRLTSDPTLAVGYCLALHEGALYVGGRFDHAGEYATSGLARWSAGAWQPVPGLASGSAEPVQVHALLEWDGLLCVGGRFESAGGHPSRNFAVLTMAGELWADLPDSDPFDAEVRALAVYQGDVVAAGAFRNAGSTVVNGIARWRSGRWEPLGSGLGGMAIGEALTVYDGQLYVGGYFSSAGGVPASNIARWDGSTWRAVGAGPSGYVLAFAEYDGRLVVGGQFNVVDDLVDVGLVATWDGSSWGRLGTGLGGAQWVNSLTVHDGRLVAVGLFNNGGGDPYADCIASWNGVAWSGLGSGMTTPGGFINAVLSRPGELFVTGRFDAIGGKSAQCISRWSGPLQNPISITSNVPPGGFVTGCPAGDADTLRITLRLPTGQVVASDHIVLEAYPWSSAVVFDRLTRADHGTSRDNGYSTTLSVARMGGCGTASLGVYVYGLSVGHTDVTVHSPDFGGDGGVTLGDVSTFSTALNQAPCPTDPGFNPCADLVFGGTGCVNLADIGVFTTHVGHSASSGSGGASAQPAEAEPTVAEVVAIERIAPNPLQPGTTVTFRLARDSAVDLGVYDVHGRLIRTLVRARRAAGTHQVPWDGRDSAGRSAPRGVYFVRLQAGADSRVGSVAKLD